MRRSREFEPGGQAIANGLGLAAVVLATIGGCAPAAEPVFIDMNRALAQTEARPPTRPRVPSPPASEGALSSSISAKPAIVIKDRPSASGAEVQRRIRAAQEQAFRDIQGRLQRFYSSEVARFELDQDKERSVAEAAAYEEASARIRRRFVEYAEARETWRPCDL